MLLLGAIAFAAATAAAPLDVPLVGKWDSERRSMGGIGNVMEFKADGSFTATIAAMVDLRYSVTGQDLKTSFEDPNTHKIEETTVRIRFDGDTLVQQAAQSGEKEVRMKREHRGEGDDPPIVGTWSYPHYTGLPAYVTFTRDGRQLFRLPMRSERGTWSATALALTTTLASGARASYQYRIDKGVLTLTDDGGKEFTYRRAVSR